MYTLLEIEDPDKYRSKLPSSHQNELNANILQTKKLISGGPEHSSRYDGVSSKVSQVSNIVARLTFNPPPKERSFRPSLVKK